MTDFIKKPKASMADTIRKNLQVITSVVAILIGVTSLGAFAWKWGALVKEFELFKESNRKDVLALDARVDKIERQGSYQVTEHIKLDDYREASTKERLVRLDVIVDMVPDLVTKLAVMDVKLDDLKKSLEKHEKTTDTNR